MLPEPTPRMLVADLYRLHTEQNHVHEDGIRSIHYGGHGEEEFAERDRLMEEQETLRNHLRTGGEQ